MINLPRDQLPVPLRRKLVFGDREQIEALRDLEIRIEQCDVGTLKINPACVNNVRYGSQIPPRSLVKLKTMAELISMAADGMPDNLKGVGPILQDIVTEASGLVG